MTIIGVPPSRGRPVGGLTLVHRSLSFSTFGLLLALGLCIPTHQLSLLPGLPLQMRGGLLVVGIMAASFALGGLVIPRARLWITFAVAIIGLRAAAGAL